MTPENKTSLAAYNKTASMLAGIYNQLASGTVLPGLEERLPVSAAGKTLSALDLGCGAGRDAYWLAQDKGFDVVAIDGSEEMIRLARQEKMHPAILYMVDVLPGIERVKSTGKKFDVVLMSAVWMHLNGEERQILVDNLAGITNEHALIYISLRDGPSPADRPMFPVSVEEVRDIALNRHMDFEHLGRVEDKQGRGRVFWEYVTLKL
ncbi:MAG TPA: class I SAM-dependent methyltransferase [Micavibrio sp.]|jgi:SAM-dependent methyltransferase